jgi:hypothetical protein
MVERYAENPIPESGVEPTNVLLTLGKRDNSILCEYFNYWIQMW